MSHVDVKRPRSVAWSYFQKGQNGEKSTYCVLCGTRTRGFSTSSMFNHLRFKHPEKFNEAKSLKDETKGQTVRVSNRVNAVTKTAGKRGPKPKKVVEPPPGIVTKQEFGVVTKPSFATTPRKMDRETVSVNRALVKLLTVDLIPGSIIDGVGFRELLAALDCRYTLPDKKTVQGTMLPEMVNETKQRLRLEVSTIDWIALSVDTWSYRDTQCYITLTGHFVKNWSMQSVVLDSFGCVDETSATEVATGLKTITDDWGVTDKVSAFVSENVDHIIYTSISTGWQNLSCFGSLLNQIVLNAIKCVPEVVRLQKKVNETVNYFLCHARASESLTAMQVQHNLAVHKLKKDVATRWNSTYAMFQRMLEQYEPVNTVLCTLQQDNLCIFDDEVDTIRSFMQVLVPFNAATDELSSSSYSQMSKVIPISSLLLQVTKFSKNFESETQSQLKDALVKQMELVFPNLELSPCLAVSTLLDPRFKKHGFTNKQALETAEQNLMTELVANLSESLTFNLPTFVATTPNLEKSGGSFWGLFDQKISEAGAAKSADSEADNEIRRYFKEAVAERSSDPLTWWQLNEIQYPNLKLLAQKYLCIPSTATVSERVFTKRAELDSFKRDQIPMQHLLNTVFLNKNL